MKLKWQPRRLAVLALTAWLAAAVLPPGAAAQSSPEDTFQRISDKLICQCGCNYGLSYCPHLECPSAPVLRATIREKLAAGQSEEEVLQAMVAQFGPAVLGAPPAEGFNLTAWVMPFLALLVGLYLTQQVVRRWRRRKPEPAADPALVERYRASIEREIKELEE
ncbi:MAG: cytochrome c-type biogenesis protein CcmH [Terriglobia bacterium]